MKFLYLVKVDKNYLDESKRSINTWGVKKNFIFISDYTDLSKGVFEYNSLKNEIDKCDWIIISTQNVFIFTDKLEKFLFSANRNSTYYFDNENFIINKDVLSDFKYNLSEYIGIEKIELGDGFFTLINRENGQYFLTEYGNKWIHTEFYDIYNKVKERLTISVIFPTRNGIENCNEAIKSIVERSSGENNIEILLKIDFDDIETLKNLDKLEYKDKIKVIVYDRMLGYVSVHEFYNDMARLSKGNWILVFNDDLRILNKNWDLDYRKYDYNIPYVLKHLPVHDEKYGTGDYYFPSLSRAYVNTTGHVSEFFSCDGYTLAICNSMQKLYNIKIYSSINLLLYVIKTDMKKRDLNLRCGYLTQEDQDVMVVKREKVVRLLKEHYDNLKIQG